MPTPLATRSKVAPDEYLDHAIVLDETHLRRSLARFFDYYHRARCHLSLDGDAPTPRPILSTEMVR